MHLKKFGLVIYTLKRIRFGYNCNELVNASFFSGTRSPWLHIYPRSITYGRTQKKEAVMEDAQRMTDTQEARAFGIARIIAETGAGAGRSARERIVAVAPWTDSRWNPETFRYCAGWIELLEFNRK